ncbi:MAG: hypothetical protein PGN08_06025 [Sphingomonas taxi]
MRMAGWWAMASAVATIVTPAMAQQARPKAAPIPVATDAPLAPASVAHTLDLGDGRRIAYRAGWFETVLRDPAGVPEATISATSYVRSDAGAAARPVLVLFNGGPGASSSPLHFSAFGPRRVGPRDAAGERALLDNRETLLDVADLLFVDPVGTGFSRPLRADGGKRYWTVEGDAAATLTLVREWLRANGRTGSPLFLAGESYGAYRLGTMASHLDGLSVAGLILISPALDFATAADQAAVDRLPTMAVAAWRQGRAKGEGDVAAIWEAARRFAEHDYAAALQQGSLLPAAERARVAAAVARTIGVPAGADLRPDTQSFLETLVPGSIVGRLDVRVAQPARPPANSDRPAAANDPSLGLGRSNVITSRPIATYLTQDIGVRTTRDYYSLTLDVNFNWDWNRPVTEPGETWSVVPAIATLMAARPAVRLLAVGGYYDLATPWLATRHALSRGDLPQDRVTLLALPSGHSPFEGDAERVVGARAVRTFLAGTK